MKTLLVSFQNGLLAEAIMRNLHETGEFQLFRLQDNQTVADDCRTLSADILLMEVSYAQGATLEPRLSISKQVRNNSPDCKIVMLCDDKSSPDIAHDVMLAKKEGKIDAFFYSSVTGNYLTAALNAL